MLKIYHQPIEVRYSKSEMNITLAQLIECVKEVNDINIEYSC